MVKSKNVFIFSAPSGCGKTSLAHALIKSRNDVAIAISHTTRNKRPGEKEGVDYFYIDTSAFEKMIKQQAFIEYARVFDNWYGTSISAVKDLLALGKHVILDIDWQGARQVRKQYGDVISVFILPPSIEALAQRLRARGQDDEATIERRMEGAKNELLHQDEYDHVIINDDFDKALAELNTLLD